MDGRIAPEERCWLPLAPLPCFSGGCGLRKPTASALERKKNQKITRVTENATWCGAGLG